MPAAALVLASALTLSVPATALADEAGARRAAHIRAHYAKYEYRIPMRDGARLFTSVYVPLDASPAKRYPILLTRTPYGVAPYGPDLHRATLGPAEGFEREGFIFVWQDVRGRYMSEGAFVDVRPHRPVKGPRDVDESTDAWDTVDWLVRHLPTGNGKVGLWGLSYGGFYTSAGIIDTHPAIAAASPQAPIGDWYWDDMHRHGAFNLALTFLFYSGFGKARDSLTVERNDRFDMGTPDGYQFFLDMGPLSNANALHLKDGVAMWNDMVAHPDYDAFWKERRILSHLRNVRCPVLTVGGWFDTEDLYGPLHTYATLERENPRIANRLVMGPWAHGQWIRETGDSLGSARFGSATSTWYQEHVALPFFVQHLKGGPPADLAEATVFETGANRWRRFDAWPPPGARARDLFLCAGGTLAWEPPGDGDGAADAYVSDPAKPVPYTAEIESGWSREYMTEDQRFAARRPDVLVYRSEPLREDLTLAGPLEAELWVTTTGTDADFVVKLIDEYPGRRRGMPEAEAARFPGGHQMLVRGEPFRGRYREDYAKPVPFTPGAPTRIAFRINDVCHTFKRGHRIMVQVQSAWFPFIDRNPQTFVPNIFLARPEDFVAATHRVLCSKEHASKVTVRVLPGQP
jgi:hypothetical protein